MPSAKQRLATTTENLKWQGNSDEASTSGLGPAFGLGRIPGGSNPKPVITVWNNCNRKIAVHCTMASVFRSKSVADRIGGKSPDSVYDRGLRVCCKILMLHGCYHNIDTCRLFDPSGSSKRCRSRYPIPHRTSPLHHQVPAEWLRLRLKPLPILILCTARH